MEIIQRLRKERQALVDRIELIDKMLHTYEAWGREAELLLALTEEPTRAKESVRFHDVPHTARDMRLAALDRLQWKHRSRTPIEQFERAVLDVLRNSDVPMDRVALYDALTSRGVIIGDGDRDKELNVLSARVYRMAKDGKILSQRGEGYRLNFDYEDTEQGGKSGADDALRDDEYKQSAKGDSDLDDMM